MTESIGNNRSLRGAWGASLNSSNTSEGEFSILHWHESDTQIHWAAHLDISQGPFQKRLPPYWTPLGCPRAVTILLGHLLAKSPSAHFFIGSAAWPPGPGSSTVLGWDNLISSLHNPQWILVHSSFPRGNSTLEKKNFGPEPHSAWVACILPARPLHLQGSCS